MKIMSWMELPILEQLFIGKKAVVFVKMPYGKVEKHAYKINEKNKLEVYAGYGTEGKKIYNPGVRGKQVFDVKGRLMFTWDYGADFAYSMFNRNVFEEKKQTDELVEQAFGTGVTIGELKARGLGRKNPLQDPVVIAVAFCVLVTFVNLAITYIGLTSIGNEMGIKFF